MKLLKHMKIKENYLKSVVLNDFINNRMWARMSENKENWLGQKRPEYLLWGIIYSLAT